MNLIRILKLAPYLPECQYETRYCQIYCTPVNWEQFFITEVVCIGQKPTLTIIHNIAAYTGISIRCMIVKIENSCRERNRMNIRRYLYNVFALLRLLVYPVHCK